MASLLKRAMDSAPPAEQLDTQRLLIETRGQLEEARKENGELKGKLTKQAADLVEAQTKITRLESEMQKLQGQNAVSVTTSSQTPHNSLATKAQHFAWDAWDICGLELCGISAVVTSYAAYSTNIMALWTIPASVTAAGALFIARFFQADDAFRGLSSCVIGVIALVGGGAGTKAVWTEDAAEINNFEPTFVLRELTGEDTVVIPYRYEPVSRVMRFEGKELKVTIPTSKTEQHSRTLSCVQYWRGGIDVANKDLPTFDKSSVRLNRDPYKENGDCGLAKTWQAALAKSPAPGN